MVHEANGGISGHKQHTAWDPSDRMTPDMMPDLSTQKTSSKKRSFEPYKPAAQAAQARKLESMQPGLIPRVRGANCASNPTILS